MLSDAEALRFGRNVLLPEIGLSGQERLRASIVELRGLGAVGSAAALYLAAAGIGGIDLEDEAPVEPTDLTGTLYTATDVGTPRAAAAARALAALDPGLKLGGSGLGPIAATFGRALTARDSREGLVVRGAGLEAQAAGGPEALLAGALLAAEAVKAILEIGEPLLLEGLS